MSVLGTLITAVTLPAVLAHEATHYLLALPVAANVRLQGALSARPTCEVEWGEAPAWARAVAASGPLVCGVVLALSGLLWAASAGVGEIPTTTRRWLLVGVAATWWGIYTYPSRADRATAREVFDDAS
jgi:hypothetical protein